MLGSEGSRTLHDENGVLQVGEQRVLVVTLVPQKHQEPGEREGSPELGLTCQARVQARLQTLRTGAGSWTNQGDWAPN